MTARTRGAIGTVGLLVCVVLAVGSAPAQAADALRAQAVGRFLDGTAGGRPIESIVDVKDARATSPGTASDQNPFDVRLFDQADLPLTDAISIPAQPAVDAGAVNQVAIANRNGSSLGASGAVADDGGASIGDDNDGAPALAKLDLSDAALGSVPIPGLPTLPGVPGGGSSGLPALGGLTASLGAVYAQAGTRSGGAFRTPASGVASMNLELSSPALGAVLTQLKSVFGGNVGELPGLSSLPLPSGFELPAKCALTDPTPSRIDLGNGIVVDPAGAGIKISVGTLVSKVLGDNLSDLDTSNFDLVSFLVHNLPKILSQGLTTTVTDALTSLNEQFTACVGAVKTAPGIGDVLSTLLDTLDKGQDQFADAVKQVGDQFATAGAAGLDALADGLKKVVDIGLNVQHGPAHEARNAKYPFDTNLEATPDQSTPTVTGQSVVRAIEIQLLDAAPDGGAATLALGNAAAGPGTQPVAGRGVSPKSAGPRTSNALPTSVPAGSAAHGQDSTVLPLLAVIVALAALGSGVATYRRRRGLS